MLSKTLVDERRHPPARLVLRRGMRGTKKLTDAYGDRFLCARYRYDPVRKKRIKTAEIIVEEIHWKPNSYEGLLPNLKATIRIDIQESDIRQTVKQAGGRWNPALKLWELPLPTVYELDLENRLVFKEDLEKHIGSI